MEKSTLPEEQKNEVLGQAYFFRAWRYYNMFKFYGGLPIVTQVLNPTADAFTPRSTSKETYEFILNDLEKSAELLMEKTANGGWGTGDWGRVTSGTALALKGRLMLLWASPLFNRKNDQSRWQEAYEEMKEDLIVINACGHGLYKTSNNVNGSDFANQFVQTTRNPEAVFVVNYNTTAILTGIDDAAKNNAWERFIRPAHVAFLPLGGSGQEWQQSGPVHDEMVRRLHEVGEMALAAGKVIGIRAQMNACANLQLLKEVNSEGIKIYYNLQDAVDQGRNPYKGYSYEAYTNSAIGLGKGSHELFVGYQTTLDFSKKGRNRHQSVRIL